MDELRMAQYADLKRQFLRYKGSLSQFAKEHAEEIGVTPKAIQEHGRHHKWIAEREKYIRKVEKKALEKIIDRDAEKAVRTLGMQSDIVERLTQVLKKAVEDDSQFNRYLVQSTHGDVTDTEERIYGKLDTKAVKDTAQALKDMTNITRNINELPTLAEKQAQQDREERLKIDREKLDRANADGTATINLYFNDPENETVVNSEDVEDDRREGRVIECEHGEPVVKSVTEWEDGTVEVDS